MKIAILSDTHGNLETTAKAIKTLRSSPIDVVLHCGDVCGKKVVELLSDWETHYVYGNCDSPSDVDWAIELHGGVCHQLYGSLTLDGKKIALLHGHENYRLQQVIQSGEHDYVFHGHTHVIRDETFGPTRVINPGALHRAKPKSFAILDLHSGELEVIKLASI